MVGRPFLFFAELFQHDVSVNPANVANPGKPVRDDAIGVEHDNHRMGDTVRIAAGGVALVQQAEGADDLGTGVGEDRKLYFTAFGETRYFRHAIIGYGRDLVAELSEIIDSDIPGDRLDNAEESPIERS